MSISVVEQGVPLSSVPRARRAPGVDVVRALALVGVCFMNFYGYLITRGGQRAAGLAGQVLDPGVGVLATRFAATFVVVAGMGVSLMARSGGSLSVLRWRLVRRGVLLFTFGFFFNWVWPGTILFFYGAFFVASALLVRLSSKRLATVAGVVVGLSSAVQSWAHARLAAGHSAAWLVVGRGESDTSPRGLLLDVLVRGTHPVLPWLAFMCFGIYLGRLFPLVAASRKVLALTSAGVVVGAYVLSALNFGPAWLRSTEPWDRGGLYVLSATGVALLAICAIDGVAELCHNRWLVRVLATTGRMSLSVYVLHALVFNLVVDVLRWVRPSGVGLAVVFAVVFWAFAVVVTNVVASRWSSGPFEFVYRKFGG